MRNIYIIIIQLASVFVSANLQADEAKIYENRMWGFKINAPAGWVITESQDFLKFIKEQNPSKDVSAVIENSGLVVMISQYPLNNKSPFNPNISISAKHLEIDPKPQNEMQMIDFAKNLLGKMFLGKQKFSEPQVVNINDLKGVRSDYPINNGNLHLKGRLYILINQANGNYFIISTTTNESDSSPRVADESVRTIQKL